MDSLRLGGQVDFAVRHYGRVIELSTHSNLPEQAWFLFAWPGLAKELIRCS